MSKHNRRDIAQDIAKAVELLRAANEGILEGMTCPWCAKPCVEVWFTHPTERAYRTWLICGNCAFEVRAINTGRPPHYSKERDRTAGDAAKDRRLLATDHWS